MIQNYEDIIFILFKSTYILHEIDLSRRKGEQLDIIRRLQFNLEKQKNERLYYNIFVKKKEEREREAILIHRWEGNLENI